MHKNTCSCANKKKHPVTGEGQMELVVSDVSECLNKLQYIALQCSAVSGFIFLGQMTKEGQMGPNI